MRQPPDTPEAGKAGAAVATTADLLQRARLGDSDALNELFGRYLPSLRRWARGRLPSWTRDLRDTDDLVQETFLRAYRHWHTFDRGSDCKSWMSTICRNAFF